MDTVGEVRAFYDADPALEWERLAQHPFEFEITKAYLRRYVKSGDRVLDLGGGPGRYSLYLAGLGCRVTLVDLSPGNVALAAERAAEAGVEITALAGDARQAQALVQGPFDHVLLMGPLYHLQQQADRDAVAAACLRLLKPGGLLFASFISSYAGMVYYLKLAPEMLALPAAQEDIRQFIEDAPFSGRAFTQAYFARSGDIAPWMEGLGYRTRHLFSQEGILAPNEETLKLQPPEVLEKLVEIGLAVCERPDLLSWAEHLMYVGQKPEVAAG